MKSLPEKILAYWQTISGAPPLWLEYSPEPEALPVAIYSPSEFDRDQANIMQLDRYRYNFKIWGLTPEATYEAGKTAADAMNNFNCDGLSSVYVVPKGAATSMQTGQGLLWMYEFDCDFRGRTV